MNCRRYIHRFLRCSGLVAVLVAAALGATWQWLATQEHVYASHGVLESTWEQQIGLHHSMFDPTVKSLTAEKFLFQVAKQFGLPEAASNSAAGGQITPEQVRKVAEILRRHLKVSWRTTKVNASGTRLIDIVAEESSPERARQLVAAVMETFVDDLKAQARGPMRNAMDTLPPEIEKQQRVLSALEKELKDYRDLHPTVSFGNKEVLPLETEISYWREYSTAKAKRAAVADDLAAMKIIQEGDLDALLKIPSVNLLPAVALLNNAIKAREGELGRLKQQYGAVPTKYQAAETELGELKLKRHVALSGAGEPVRQEFELVSRKETQLKALLDDIRQENQEVRKVIVPYSDLHRRVDSAREFLTTLTNRLRTITLFEKESEISVRVKEEPLANLWPVRPDKGKSMLIAGLAALLFGLGLNFLINRFDSCKQKAGGD